ncbi:uncharacterized protein LOC120396366 isoform X1 [Mauremys reevesii]|uniref:uncharacterized protein LOC120396366 isoform X1 n=1 Tax=Mauremys reevesii TaxID=260615 RepID=UPI00193FA471|nr:uncharacterized protein LOC120396366 isoform X1 [Mauremys reevesii]XP_039377093.1 uncharacterized protein LOC120396366 isoform X1 [Mauremys reevesii]XP_039377095.1 uncharacterized protein LOC120396366 isoform X1 [Mauremys reevesii]
MENHTLLTEEKHPQRTCVRILDSIARKKLQPPSQQGIVQLPFQPHLVRESKEEGQGQTNAEHLPPSTAPSRANSWLVPTQFQDGEAQSDAGEEGCRRGSRASGKQLLASPGGEPPLCPCWRGSSLWPGQAVQVPGVLEEENTFRVNMEVTQGTAGAGQGGSGASSPGSRGARSTAPGPRWSYPPDWPPACPGQVIGHHCSSTSSSTYSLGASKTILVLLQGVSFWPPKFGVVPLCP